MVSQHPHLLAQEAYQRGMQRQRVGQKREALDDFLKAVSLNPDLAEAHYQIGELRLTHEPEKAIASFNEVVRLWPDRADGYALRGSARCFIGRYDEALADLERASTIDPNLPQPYHDRAVILTKRNLHNEAETLFTRSIQIEPSSAESWFDRGCVRAAMGRFTEALEDLDHAISLNPRQARFHFSRGMTLVRVGRAEEGLEEFTRTLRLDPDMKNVAIERASALHQLGRSEEALREANKAVGQGGDRLADALTLRSELHTKNHDYTKSLADLDRLAKIEPDNVKFTLARATLNFQLNNIEKALELAGHAIAQEPTNPRTHLSRGAMLQTLNRWEESLPDAYRTTELDPTDSFGWLMIGEALKKMKRYKEALPAMRRMVELAPDDAANLNSLAWLLASCEDDEVRNGTEAISISLRAIALSGNPPDPIFIDTLATAYAETGDFAKAIDLCQNALPTCPPERAEELREHLRRFKAGQTVRMK